MKPLIWKLPTAQSLENAALHYLGRYAASEASLRAMLENRLRRAGMRNPDFAQDAAAHELLRKAIESIIAKYKRNGILNDKAFAETKVNSLRRQGRSRRAIVQKLGAKGLPFSLVHEALQQNAEEKTPEEAELAAAIALVRRRKLGPFRKKEADSDAQRKELAALARAGFPLDIAKKALRTDEELWDE
jgi:regulatory protein